MHVDKELFGDTFRAPPRLTPLEARAIRLALEFVGPMIAADAHTPLDRVRAKLEETFGAVRARQTPQPTVGSAEEELVATLSAGDPTASDSSRSSTRRRARSAPTTRVVEPYAIERELPHWYVHTFDRTSERSAQLPARPDAQGEAR